ncbi:MAG: hypothetical protein E3J35_04235 [Methanomassiliicoccales archaeon]|nr:MAG: hypothetical protein E3J35_04235 [Methanomassiliicoccales archaeon]
MEWTEIAVREGFVLDDEELRRKVHEILEREFNPFECLNDAWKGLRRTELFRDMEYALFRHYWKQVRGLGVIEVRPGKRSRR